MQERFSPASLKVALFFSIAYLLWVVLLVGLRSDHLLFYGFLLIMFFTTSTSRLIVKGFIFFIIYWILYDGMRVYPNYLLNPVHIMEPYILEKKLFGFFSNGVKLTPNEWFFEHQHPILDFLAGGFYLTWVPLPFAFALWLLRHKKRLLLRFSAAFLFTNLVGFIIYYTYPAAPPWYVAQYGDVKSFDILGSAALLENFDQIIGTPLYSNMYTKNANVFAAIPSLHAAYPIVLTFYGFKAKLKYMKWFFAFTIVGIWFGAIYTSHHYLIDLILGAFCAIFAIFVFERYVMQTKCSEYIDRYAKKLSV